MLMSMVHEQHIFQYRGEDRHHIQPQRPEPATTDVWAEFQPPISSHPHRSSSLQMWLLEGQDVSTEMVVPVAFGMKQMVC
jgi:hypothetical protein